MSAAHLPKYLAEVTFNAASYPQQIQTHLDGLLFISSYDTL